MSDPAVRPACKAFQENRCRRGANACSRRHVHETVCWHWIRGLCQRGSNCPYLHVYEETRFPRCWFLDSLGHCKNQESCPARHDEGLERVPECPAYVAGFCSRGG